jgi:hypothetical protein
VSGLNPNELVTQVNAKAATISEKYKVDPVNSTDPEFSMVKWTTPDPEYHLETLEKATQAKAARLAVSATPKETPEQIAARIPGASGGGSVGLPSNASPYELLHMATEESRRKQN